MGGLFSAPKPIVLQQPAPAPVPTPTPVAPLPTVDAEGVRQARQLNTAEALARGGRRSTILTSAQSRGGGGGDPYASKQFGS
jgi:hypothetical protein